jgi:hypothetical protein
LSHINDIFTLEERELKFQFSGECSFQQREHPEGIKKITFEVSLKNNGIIIGTLKIASKECSVEKIKTYFTDSFSLNGQDTVTGLSIIMEKCFVRQWGLFINNELNCDFLLSDIILGKDNLTKTLLSTTRFHFGLINVFRIRRIESPFSRIIFRKNDRTAWDIDLSDLDKIVSSSHVGKLEFYNYANIDENEKIMLTFRLPLITAGISVEFSKTSHNLESALEEVRKLVEDFMILSSFIQTSRHNWKFIVILTNDNLAFIHIRALKHDLPMLFPLNNGIRNFTLYEQFKELSTNRYKNNIALALYWYLESVANEQIDSKFLQMFTALECLLDAYHKERQSEYILSETDFSLLQQKIMPEIREALQKLGYKNKFETIKNAFKGLRRRSLSNKFKLMLDELQVNCSDVHLRPHAIVDIRNDITHRGGINHVNDETELKTVKDQYNALWSVMIRLFLKLLEYKGNYYDPYLKSLNAI